MKSADYKEIHFLDSYLTNNKAMADHFYQQKVTISTQHSRVTISTFSIVIIVLIVIIFLHYNFAPMNLDVLSLFNVVSNRLKSKKYIIW